MEQKQKLRQWAGSYRFVFNWTISRKEEEYQQFGVSGTYMGQRKVWKEDLLGVAPWINEIPAHTIYGAMMDADRAYKLVVGKRSKGAESKLPRCRKHKQKSFYILGNAISPKGIYPRLLGLMRSAEPLPLKPKDSRIMFECGQWHLCVPETVPVTHTESQGIVSLDPGIRTFVTAFSQTSLHKVAQGSFGRIVRLAQYLDDLLSRSSKESCRKKKRMLRAASRMRRKIRRLVDDLHYQTIGWLFRNYQTVIFPEGDFTSACEKAKRKIMRKSVRSLMTYSFARFRDRLIHKAQAIGRNVLIVNEAFTSKTANLTGEMVNNLGGRKVITSQGMKMDRDVNGALGIMLKALVDNPVAVYRNCNC